MGREGGRWRGRGRGGWRGQGRGRGGGGSKWRGRGRGQDSGQHDRSDGGRGSGRGRCFSTQRPQVIGPRLMEKDVGMTEYIGSHIGFTGVLKHRYSDFIVNEIDLDGNVIKITSLDPPKEESSEILLERHDLIPEDVWASLFQLVGRKPVTSKSLEVVNSEPKENKSNTIEPVKLDVVDPSHSKENIKLKQQDDSQENLDVIPSDKVEILDSIQEVECKKTEKSNAVELEVTRLTKEDRRNIHECVKNNFGSDITSNTKERDEKKFIIFSSSKSFSGKQHGRDTRSRWPKERGGEYLHFVLNKTNMDTTETINLISRKLKLQPSALTCAGTKDKRGTTSQLMCLRRGEPKRLSDIGRYLRDIRLGNFRFKPNQLQLGDLKGNQFQIALRNVSGSNEEIEAAAMSLRDKGFINYYGLQRFGTYSAVPTHEVGKALLRGDWKKAVELILQPRNRGCDQDDVDAAREEWTDSRDAKKALEKLRRGHHTLEGVLLGGLAKCDPNDYINALSVLPRNTRLMYLHAYQSYVWNQIASRRIREFGLKPMVGDLVLRDPCQKAAGKIVEVENQEHIEEAIAQEDQEENAMEGCDDEPQIVRVVTEEELNDVKIEDVVLPLPGYNIVYPDNVVKNWYMEILKNDGLTSEGLKQKVKQYSLGGAYRSLLARPGNLTWELVHYDDPNTDLMLSDWDELKGKEKFSDVPGGKFKALLLTMMLEPSTYATMALRELMKVDTSATTQAKISEEAVRASRLSPGNEDWKMGPDTENSTQNKTEGSGTRIETEDKSELEGTKDLLEHIITESVVEGKSEVKNGGNENIQTGHSTLLENITKNQDTEHIKTESVVEGKSEEKNGVNENIQTGHSTLLENITENQDTGVSSEESLKRKCEAGSEAGVNEVKKPKTENSE